MIEHISLVEIWPSIRNSKSCITIKLCGLLLSIKQMIRDRKGHALILGIPESIAICSFVDWDLNCEFYTFDPKE